MRNRVKESVVEDKCLRFGLKWLIKPYRIVLAERQDVIVQEMPYFDMRDEVLRKGRINALAKLRKQEQRNRELSKLATSEMSRENGGVNEGE